LSAKTAVAFSLSAGNAHDAPEGQKLLATLNGKDTPLLMDRLMKEIKCVSSPKSKSLLQWYRLRRIVNIPGTTIKNSTSFVMR
jgi:hypothetical protein